VIARGLAALVVLLTASPAAAWLGDEHAAQAERAYVVAIASSGVEGADRDRLREYLLGAASPVGIGAAAPDLCHSVWHSEVASAVGAACRPATDECEINPESTLLFPSVKYVLRTNENHFGHHTQTHHHHWQQLARTAAQRWRRTRNPMCERLAIAFGSFALHYVQDHTATGHAWTQASSGFAFADAPRGEATKDINRACLHGQGFWTTVGLGCETYGLGGEPRRMATPLHDAGPFYSDDQFWEDPAEPAQRQLTFDSTMGSIREITDLLACREPVPGDPRWQQVWVSNLEMCRAVVAECCVARQEGARIAPECTDCEDRDGDDPANQDLQHEEIVAACPITAATLRRPIDRDDPRWVETDGRDGDRLTTGWLRLSEALPGGDDGSEVARTLWAEPEAPNVHPDAVWNDLDHEDVLARAGCGDLRAIGAPLRDTTCDAWPCPRRVVFCHGERSIDAACPDDPCSTHATHTVLEGGRCVCPTTAGDGMCAVDAGESFATSPDDCGPGYCGDGACCRTCEGDRAEDEDTCPVDCAAEVCGDGYCHPGEACDRDCGPPHEYEGFVCDDDGVVREPLEVTCGDGRLTPGESCQLCPRDGDTGPAYAGADACAGGPAELVDHGCTNPPTCRTITDGGWCPGRCDPDEGCVPPGLPEPECGGGPGPGPGGPPVAAIAPASGTYTQDCYGTSFDLCCLTCDGCPFVDVTLDGAGSTDPDGDPLSYAWSCPTASCDFTGTGPRPRLRYYFDTSMPSCSLLTESVRVRLEVSDGTSTDVVERLLPMTCDYRTTCF